MVKIKSYLRFVSGFFLFCILFSSNSFGQNKTIDSLIVLIKNEKSNVNKVKHLNKLSALYRSSNPDTCLSLALQALILAKEINLKSEIGNCYGNLGICFRLKSEYHKALGYFKQALVFDKELGDKKSEAIHLENIGIVRKELAEYPKAFEYYFKALKINEAIKNKHGIASNYSNIGNVYSNLGENIKALRYYLKALKIDRSLNDKAGITKRYGNIGNIYYSLQKYDIALSYYFRALKIAKEIGDKNGTAADLGNIGNVYYDKENYILALDYYLKALATNETIGDKNGMAINCGNIGSLYTKVPSLPPPNGESEKGYGLAAKYLYKAIAIDDSIGTKYGLKYRYESLSVLYEVSSDPLIDTIGGKLLNNEEMRLRSLYYYKMFIKVRDAIFNEEQKKELIRKELNFEFEKKNAIAKQESRIQRMFLVLISSIAILFLLSVIFIFLSLRKTRKQKNAIEKSNKEKELLLKEIHHRVKNNLQIISSLLKLQSNTITDASTLTVIRQAQVRVRSMGLIHQKLYQAENFSEIDFKDYLEQLTSYVSEMYYDGIGEIVCELNILEKKFNIDTATPLGLIITELLSNSYKYAFKKGENGKINISLKHIDHNNFLLVYSDSGTGLPNNLDIEKNSTLGLELVGLLTSQLNGSIKSYNNNGAVFEINFKLVLPINE